jgi:hypothetical protein
VRKYIEDNYGDPASIASLLTASWQDVLSKLGQKFYHRTITTSDFNLFVKSYLFDVKGEKVAGSAPAAAKAKGYGTPEQVSFYVLKMASPEAHYRMMLTNAANHDSELVEEVVAKVLGSNAASWDKLSFAEMKKLQRPLYHSLYGSAAPKTGFSLGPDRLPISGESMGDWRVSPVKSTGKGLVTGRGMDASNIDAKMYADQRMLNANKLCLKYKSTAKKIFGPVDLTPESRAVVVAIVTNQLGGIQKAYNKLRQEQKDIILEFCSKAKAKNVDVFQQRLKEVETLLRVAIGQRNSGNNASEIVKLIREATQELWKLGGCTRMEAQEILLQLQ